ncbi:TM2 domain-containing protein [Nonlabens xiamenensis]|uniref:TM2 domain-containing protein n=1 Tax=Nonlabens xiamenensis TaxID=2341043 RepID=UPI000F60D3C5|nr:TM2 domain-containing protein [Nonlabens xiamenensis]
MSSEDYDSTKSGFDKATDSAKEAFNHASQAAGNTAEDFKQGFNDTVNSNENKKVLAGVLGIFVGAFGVHKFILGYTNEGIILAAVTLVGLVLSCFFVGFLFVWIPGVIGLIEGIIYLTKSDEEFYQTYQVNKKAWF